MKNYIKLIGVFLAVIVFQVALSLFIIYLGGEYYIALFILVLFTLLAILLSYMILRNKRQRTREEYALNLLSNDVIIFGSFLSYINPSYYEQIIKKIGVYYLGVDEIYLSQPSLVEKILVALVIFCILYFTHRVFFKWDGGVSISEMEKRKNSSNINIFVLANDCIISLEARKVANVEEIDYDFEITPSNYKAPDWHIQAKELLRAKSKQYKFKDNNWHEEHNCYITTYGDNNIPLAIYCSLHEVSDSELSSFVKFVKIYCENKKRIIYYYLVKDKKKDKERIINSEKIHVKDKQDLLDNLMIDLDEYKEFIINKYEKESIIKGIDFALKDVYVESTCVIKNNNDNEADKQIDSIEKYIINWVNETNDKKQLAILGDYGMGKSVLSLRIAYLLITSKKCNRVPIIIELSGMFPQGDEVTILSKFTNYKKLDPKELYQLHLEGRLLLIFDGFDEMVLAGEQEHRNDHFRRLWELATPNSKIIITGRENYFLGEKEKKALLKLSYKSPLHLSYCEEIDLCTFNDIQINRYLQPWPEQTKKEILELYSMHKNGSFGDLISRPSSLFMAASIWNRLKKHINNINSAAVIKEFLHDSYDRQELKNQELKGKLVFEKDRSFLSSGERAYFMQGIALEAVNNNGYTNRIDNKSIYSCIKELYDHFPDSITIMENKGLTLLKKRGDEKNRLERIYKDVRTCGIFVIDHTSSGSMRFAHKSFMEYLVADYLANYTLIHQMDQDSVTFDKTIALGQSFPIQIAKLYNNLNVFKFITELLVADMNLNNYKDNCEKIKAIYKKLGFFDHYSFGFFKSFAILNEFLNLFFNFNYNPFLTSIVIITILLIIILFFILQIPLIAISILLIICLSLYRFIISNNQTLYNTLYYLNSQFLPGFQNPHYIFLSSYSLRRSLILFYAVCQESSLKNDLFELLPIGFCRGLDRLLNIGPNKYLEFSKDNSTLIKCKSNYEGVMIIPDGIQIIGPKSFSNCRKIISIAIPNSVTTIREWAFDCCTSLTSIEISKRVSMIGRGAFTGCTSLTSVVIPNSVADIGTGVFHACTSLTKVEILGDVTKIGDKAFEGCTNLISVEILGKVTKIGDNAFEGCSKLSSLVISSNVAEIGTSVFHGCTSLTIVKILGGVTKIGDNAFEGCDSLTSVEIPTSMVEIGREAFLACTSLTAIDIPDSMTKIGKWAFEHCTSLPTIKIPDRVTGVGFGAFAGCTNLVELHLRHKMPIDLSGSLLDVDLSKITIYVPQGSGDAYRNSGFYKEFKEIIEE